MKSILAAAVLVAVAAPAIAQVGVNGYYRKDGTYVAPHMRSAPDGNPYNNYSTIGNTNPYTGQPGTHQPQPTQSYPAPIQYPTYTPSYPVQPAPAYPTYPNPYGTR